MKAGVETSPTVVVRNKTAAPGVASSVSSGYGGQARRVQRRLEVRRINSSHGLHFSLMARDLGEEEKEVGGFI
ncbi:hypothetical protein PanWU01x14_148970 [Parasponia andersonii]|uniref:Uncharacterized protein n=1 Tax=Parasponia andersonii TaxID=3476 RepID=A0A2P5CIR6_PARAD|nr:hypothetical protein PanWU01x14_148970 [Parasponia andersonii]